MVSSSQSQNVRWLKPIRLHNCFWLLVPVMAWNLAFWDRLPARYSAEGPGWLAYCEHALRVVVTAGAAWLPLEREEPCQRAGVWVYAVGLVVYFSSWLPQLMAPNSGFAMSILVLMAPAYTPTVVFAGISMIGRSRLYGAAALSFLLIHNLVTFVQLTQ